MKFTSLSEAIHYELRLVDDFLSLLLSEEEALKQGEVELLQGLLPEKNRLIGLIEVASKDRLAFPAMAWVGHESLLNTLTTKAATVKTQHEINSKLLNLLMKDVSRRLDALRQLRGGQVVYGADGIQQSFGASRISESA